MMGQRHRARWKVAPAGASVSVSLQRNEWVLYWYEGSLAAAISISH
jgi:hypothetical protein